MCQIHHGYEGAPGMLVLNEHPLLVAGGDAFTYSKFDGCIDSAQKIANYVSQAAHQSSSLWDLDKIHKVRQQLHLERYILVLYNNLLLDVLGKSDMDDESWKTELRSGLKSFGLIYPKKQFAKMTFLLFFVALTTKLWIFFSL